MQSGELVQFFQADLLRYVEYMFDMFSDSRSKSIGSKDTS